MKTSTQCTPVPSFTPTRASLAAERDDERLEGAVLQRRAVNQTQLATVPPIVSEVLRSPGQPLDSDTRTLIEPHFGRDFSRVRVHTDAKAAESARAVNSRAYTVGRDIVFGPYTWTISQMRRALITRPLLKCSILISNRRSARSLPRQLNARSGRSGSVQPSTRCGE